MPAWLNEIVSEERLLHPGHAACAGCAPAINVRHVLGALRAARPESEIVVVIPASCWTIIAGVYPVSAFGVSVHLTPFASAAAEASAIRGALRLRGVRDPLVVVWAGDGATSDIGFSGVSAAADRNEDVIYVLNHNEAYMNTGVQRSGATPEGAWTTTTPAGAPRAGQKKDIAPRIMAAHGIPYVATLAIGSVPLLRDFRAKVTRAAEVEGFRFLHTFACPPGWRYPTDRSTEVARLSRRVACVSALGVRRRRVADHLPAEAPRAGGRLPGDPGRSSGTCRRSRSRPSRRTSTLAGSSSRHRPRTRPSSDRPAEAEGRRPSRPHLASCRRARRCASSTRCR